MVGGFRPCGAQLLWCTVIDEAIVAQSIEAIVEQDDRTIVNRNADRFAPCLGVVYLCKRHHWLRLIVLGKNKDFAVHIEHFAGSCDGKVRSDGFPFQRVGIAHMLVDIHLVNSFGKSVGGGTQHLHRLVEIDDGSTRL